MINVQIDEEKLEEMIERSLEKIVRKIMAEQDEVFGLPLVLGKKRLSEELDIGLTRTQELFNRSDFPVIRELGHPKVNTRKLIEWLDNHTEWVQTNVSSPKSGLLRRNLSHDE